jgi:glycosyltransferase involved in cell wall biosynthesis
MDTVRPVVFFTEHLEMGGAERQIVQLVQSFRSEGIGLRLVVLEARGPWLVDVFKPNDVVLARHQREGAPPGLLGQVRRTLRALRALPALRSAIKGENARAVVTFLWFPTLLASMACIGMKRRPPLIWSLQSDLANDYSRRPGGRLRQLLIRYLVVPRVSGFVAISAGVKRGFANYSGCDEKSILLCPNAVDIARMNHLAVEPGIATPKKADIRVVSVARLVPQKALHVLIQALSEIPTSEVSWECFLLGEGPLENSLKAQVNQLGVAERVAFLGSSRNPAAWIKSADIFVLPSAWEPFGIVLLEAMSLGIAVITSDSDGARELVTDGEDAWVFPVGDVAELKHRIRELSRDANKRTQLARKARLTARRYDSRRVAAAFGLTIDSIVNAEGAGGSSVIDS